MPIDVIELAIPEVKILKPERYADERGFFSETFNKRRFSDAGINVDFIQDNHSLSTASGTLRGLHYQSPPFAQAKLVRVLRGVILDVVVDVRTSSATYGQWLSVELSAESGEQIYVPHGFLHGFVTREDNTEIAYKVDAYYSKECDGAVKWNDPDLAIDWGIDNPIVSEKDHEAELFSGFKTPF